MPVENTAQRVLRTSRSWLDIKNIQASKVVETTISSIEASTEVIDFLFHLSSFLNSDA